MPHLEMSRPKTAKHCPLPDLSGLGILGDVYEFAVISVSTSHRVFRLSKNFKLKSTTFHAETETDTAS